MSTSLPFVSAVLADMAASGARQRTVDGSLVFADLSGFTPLTERFARRGQVGGELLTDLLNELFAPMLEVALDLGGDLLKFGGDALLIGFEGIGHDARALTAAWRMQAELRAVARRRRVDVGMSVGVASGPIELLCEGTSHPELVVHGEALDRCLRLEGAASQGQVFVAVGSAALVAVAAEVVGTEVDDVDEGAVELLQLREPMQSAATSSPALTQRAVPSPMRLTVLIDPLVARAIAEGALPEHRRTVVAFVHFTIGAGTDDIAAAGLGDLVDAVQEACLEQAVCLLNCDVDVGGGKFTLTAGVPVTTGDDADRMLLCTLRIVADPRARGVQVGVHEGHAFAGPVGTARRRAYTIMGDAVNAAARVMGHAGHGQVLATTDVVNRARQAFDVDPVPDFAVKGKSVKMSATIVRQATGRTVLRRIAAPIHGRDSELRTLGEHLERAADGAGSIVEVIGEPGIGKSRLVAELLVSTSVPTLRLECGRYLSRSPYGAIVEACRRWLGLDAGATERAIAERLSIVVAQRLPDLLPWLPFVAIPLGVELPDTDATAAIGSEFRGRRVQQAFADFVTAAFPGRHLLVIEDAHWLDEATVELFDSIADRLRDRGWVVIATRRPDLTGWMPDASDQLRLEPLTARAAAGLAGDLTADAPVPEHIGRRLVERSNGNPLFLEELVLAVSSGADLDDLPDRVEVLIEARIDALAAAERGVMRAAAVLGMRFDLPLLEELVPDAVSRLGELGEFVVLRDDEVRFLHALFRDTAYLTLPVRERRRLHGLAAAAIERRAEGDPNEHAEILGVHWYGAREPARAWPYLRSAATRAQADLAPFEAANFLERALACIRSAGPDARSHRPVLEEQLGDVFNTLGRFDDAERLYRRARSHATEPADRARLRGREGRVARSARSLSTALRRYRLALAEVPDDAPGVRAELLVGLCSVLERQGRIAEELGPLQEAIAAAHLAGDTATMAHAEMLLGNTFGALADPIVIHHLERALALFEGVGDIWGIASARNNLGVETYYLGEWQTSLAHYEAALAAFRRIGDEASTAMALNNIGEIHSDQGVWDDAARELDEACRIWQACAFPYGVAFAMSNRGRLALRAGDVDAAAIDLEHAKSGFEAIRALGLALEVDARIASLHLVRGDHDSALLLAEALLERDVDELQPTVRCQVLRVAALAAHRRGDASIARIHNEEARSVARSAGARYELAACAVAADEIGDLDDGERAEAEESFDQLGIRGPARRAW